MAGAELIVGVSGGSGAALGRRFVQRILGARLARLHLIVSDSALAVARSEVEPGIRTAGDWLAHLSLPKSAARLVLLHDNADVGASIASGSYPVLGMIVIPCSAGSLGAIANGVSRDLLQRAADVQLKERRPLVLAFRESPYSLIHIENMRRAALAGAVIAPPAPAFYVDSPDMSRFLDAYCVRAARLLSLTIPGEDFRWKGGARASRRRP